jgi:UDP-glucose 4-epimerase
MRVVVTGGCGFLGQNVAKSLIRHGFECIILDGQAPSDAQLLKDIEEGRCRYHSVDLKDRRCLEDVLATVGDEIHLVHLASRVSSVRSFVEVRENFETHIDVTLTLVDVLGTRTRSMCFASTIESYGVPRQARINEQHPTEPFNLYGVGKLIAEDVLKVEAAARGFRLSILRLSHIYGPGERYKKAIPNFIKACLTGSPVSLTGNGEDRRDYVHVDDVAQAIILCIKKCATGVFNISGGKSISTLEVLETVQRLCDVRLEVNHLPRTVPPLQYEFDISLARDVLGYRPMVSFEEGVQGEIAAFHAELT